MVQLSLFPKFLKSLGVDELAEALHRVGLGAVNLLVRDGYWVTNAGLPEAATGFCRRLQSQGIAVPFCTYGALPPAILADDTALRVFADNGIRGFRLGYYRWQEDAGPLPAQIRRANEDLARLLPLLERYDLRAVYQVHHGTLIPGPTAASYLMEGLPPERFGVMLDAGNQGFEGMERWERAVQVLGPHWSSLGVKDTRVERTGDDRPQRVFCPCMTGDCDWQRIAAAYAGGPGAGRDPWVFMPFYHDDDVDAHLTVLAEEVAFVRRQMQAAGLQED